MATNQRKLPKSNIYFTSASYDEYGVEHWRFKFSTVKLDLSSHDMTTRESWIDMSNIFRKHADDKLRRTFDMPTVTSKELSLIRKGVVGYIKKKCTEIQKKKLKLKLT